jgi:hypothetical protein
VAGNPTIAALSLAAYAPDIVGFPIAMSTIRELSARQEVDSGAVLRKLAT